MYTEAACLSVAVIADVGLIHLILYRDDRAIILHSPSFLAHVRLLNCHGVFKPFRMAWVLLLIIPRSCYCRNNLSSHWPVGGSFSTRDLYQGWACAGNSRGHWVTLFVALGLCGAQQVNVNETVSLFFFSAICIAEKKMACAGMCVTLLFSMRAGVSIHLSSVTIRNRYKNYMSYKLDCLEPSGAHILSRLASSSFTVKY